MPSLVDWIPRLGILIYYYIINLLFFLYFSNPPPAGPSQRSNTVRFDPDPPQNGAVPLVPLYESQSLSMQLGSESVLQVENINTTSDDAIFSNENKV